VTIKVPSTIEVWDVQGRQELYDVGGSAHRRPMFLTNPTRLVCAELATDRGEEWWAEHVSIYEAETGKALGELGLLQPQTAASKNVEP